MRLRYQFVEIGDCESRKLEKRKQLDPRITHECPTGIRIIRFHSFFPYRIFNRGLITASSYLFLYRIKINKDGSRECVQLR